MLVQRIFFFFCTSKEISAPLVAAIQQVSDIFAAKPEL